MISAGLPLIQSLDIVGKGNEKKKMQRVVLDVKNEVSGGKNFSDALSLHPEQFNKLFCSLIRSAEQSGTLDTMLKRYCGLS